MPRLTIDPFANCILVPTAVARQTGTMDTREKSFSETSFELRIELKKGQKQGRDETMQEDYRTSAKIHIRCQVVFLRSFISTLFLSFFSAPPSTEMKF